MKKILLSLAAIIVVALLVVFYFFYNDTKDPYVKACDFSVPEEIIPTFTEVDFSFENKFDNKKSLPLMGSAIIDVDGDGVDEVFVGGGYGQEDGLFQFKDNAFKDISQKVSLPKKGKPATLGAVSFDMDKDGQVDLLIARENGVFFYKNDAGKFTSQKLEVPLNEKSSPATFALGDVNKDGQVDIFLCAYIRLEKMEGQTIFNDLDYGANSLLLLNNGDNTFRDVTREAGLEYTHNTFQAVFVDVDKDGWLDLVVAYDTGEARTYKNQDGTHFKLMPNPLTGKFGYPMGIAVGDYNNDGRTDFFFSNTGTSVPKFVAKGDLRDDQELVVDWLLFRNDGNFQFTEVGKEAKVADFEFSWGAVFEDFNLDGKQDLVVAENYVDFPPHKAFKLPCRFLLQRDDGTFSSVEEQAKAVNKNYAITPLVSDFNQDGYPDLVYVNLDGPVKAFLNDGGNNPFLKVRFREESENSGATVEVVTGSGKRLSDVYVVGEGLAGDQTNTLTFGMKGEISAKSIAISYPSGRRDTILNPVLNATYKMKRDSSSVGNRQ